MRPFGSALRAWFEGNKGAELIIRRDDGVENTLPVGYFFRDPSRFTPIEYRVMDLCYGRVLDVGAGTGLFSLPIQEKGIIVTAIDIDPHAVEIMERRGVEKTVCRDVFTYNGGPFDSIFLLGHGIGMVGTLAGLDRFLNHTHRLLKSDGQLLIETLDVRFTEDQVNRAYHEANRREGRYIGEIRIQLEYEGVSGPYTGWLHVDADTLTNHARETGWKCRVMKQGDRGDYLARLTKINTRYK